LLDGNSGKMAGFVIACKLYIRMRISEKLVKRQMHWILIYIYICREKQQMYRRKMF